MNTVWKIFDSAAQKKPPAKASRATQIFALKDKHTTPWSTWLSARVRRVNPQFLKTFCNAALQVRLGLEPVGLKTHSFQDIYGFIFALSVFINLRVGENGYRNTVRISLSLCKRIS